MIGKRVVMMKGYGILTLLLLLLIAGLGNSAAYVSGRSPTDIGVYTNELSPGWENYSWGSNIDLQNGSPVHGDSGASIAVTYTGEWGGLYLHTAALDVSGYDSLRFWLHGGSAGGQGISVSLDFGDTYPVTATAGSWQEVEIPLSEFGNPATVSDLVWQDNTGGAQPTFYVDDVAFVGDGTSPSPTLELELSVDAAASRHPISPYVYGMNFASQQAAAELNLPVRRRGGNSTTRYNWQIDVHNTGLDWYFENIPEPNAYGPDLPDNSAADLFVEQDQQTGTGTILTMPLIGWTPKPGAASHPYDCGFKVSKYGAQDSVDSWDPDCGNGAQGGAPITGNDPTDTSIPITETFVISWINHLTGKYGTAAEGGVQFYSLDNEPMLWNSTHRDVHPIPVDYDEMRDRTYAYGAVIKAADPSAETLGPVVWGWCAYFYSAADDCRPGDDHQEYGDFVPWYLAQMAAYEQVNGQRILDYLDMHIYPLTTGVHSESLGSAAVQVARLRSTRQLWDPSYIHEASWINQPVYLIPRMQGWISENYPGTKTAITEYNWGAHGYMNGALAQADLLGIFGREGLDLATLWSPPEIDEPAMFAFRMYRNYDGQGTAFGQTSVEATSEDQGQLAIYAAQRSGDGALTLMVINKTADSVTGTVTLSNFEPAAYAQVYRYSSADLNAIVREPDQVVLVDGFTSVFPANSISLLILPPGTPLTPRLYLPLVVSGHAAAVRDVALSPAGRRVSCYRGRCFSSDLRGPFAESERVRTWHRD